MSSTFSLKYMSRRVTCALSLLQLCGIATGLAVLVALSPFFVANASTEGAELGPEAALAAAAAENEVLAAEAAPAAEPLSPRLRAALGYVSKRYRVAPEALRPIFHAVQSSSQELSLDPLLIVAVIGIESRFNPFSQSVMGAQGLMQVIPRFHRDKLPSDAGKAALLDPVVNVRVGAQALEEAIRRNGGLMAGLQQFAGASKDLDQAYATKVLVEKQRLEEAANRQLLLSRS